MKYNLSAIARRANSYIKTLGKSAAFKKAWAEEKLDIAENAMFILQMKDRWNDSDRAEASALRQEIAKQQIIIAPAMSVVEAPKELTWEEEFAALDEEFKDDPFIRSLRKAA